jgi:hypothetical protein
MGLSLQHLLWYAAEKEDTLNRIFIGDESWVHHYQPESKHSSMRENKHFADDKQVEMKVRKRLRQWSKDIYATNFEA